MPPFKTVSARRAAYHRCACSWRTKRDSTALYRLQVSLRRAWAKLFYLDEVGRYHRYQP